MQDKIIDKRFSKISDLMGSKFLFFDSELQSMYNNVEELYQTMKNVKKRFDRKETLRISKTQTEYMQLYEDSKKYPYVLYNFICLDFNIAISRLFHTYYIYCNSGEKKFKPDLERFYKYPYFYGGFDTLNEAVYYFKRTVLQYISENFGELPF